MKRRAGDSGSQNGSRRVFVGYRRADIPDAAHWIVRELERRYGKGNVFLDVDKISPGRPYATVIAEWVEKADVFLAVIGPGWLGAETGGVRRIMQPEDFVRREVEIAMQAGKPVIPVLFEDAAVPEAKDLPESLASLPDVQALHVTREHFDADIGRLERAIDEIANPSANPSTRPPRSASKTNWQRRPGARAAWIGVLAVALVTMAVLLATKSSPKPSANTESAPPSTEATTPPATTTTPPIKTTTPPATATTTTTSTTSGGSRPGAGQVVGSYWSDIEHQRFAAAWGLLDSNAKAKTKENEQQFVEGHKNEGVTSASFSGKSSYEGESARVNVSLLRTEDGAHACRKWHGYYAMKAEEGRWLIYEANIEHEAC